MVVLYVFATPVPVIYLRGTHINYYLDSTSVSISPATATAAFTAAGTYKYWFSHKQTNVLF